LSESHAAANGSPGGATDLEARDRLPHERILEVARDMFCRDGIHATGIDRILAAAGASKMTLYARFGSKEALVRAVLREEGAAWRAAFFAALTQAGDDPAVRLRRVVPALAAWFHGDRFYGCAFMNAVAEHTKGEPWLRELAAEHHREILAFLTAQATAAGYAEPVLVARQVLLLMDGMIAATLVSGDEAVLVVAERTLEAILRPL
jgi:AcrR family transcriptional regulator